MRFTFPVQLSIAVLVCALWFPGQSGAIEIRFEHDTYHVAPGQTIALRTSLSQPVTDGVAAFGLRLNFPAGLVTLSDEAIVVPPALDNDLFSEGPAERQVTAGLAVVQGFSAMDGQPYAGATFVTFWITVAAGVEGGSHTLELGLADPGANNFIDGNLNVIDEQLQFGTAGLVVTSSVPPPVLTVPERVSEAGHIRFQILGVSNRDYEIQTSTNLIHWSSLGMRTADSEGTIDFVDEQADLFTARFYRAVTGR